MSGRDLNCFQFVFGHVLDLTFGLFVLFCQLKMFTVASAVQDVSQLQMSGFSVCTVSHFAVLEKAVEKGQMSKWRQSILCMRTAVILFMLAAVILCMLRAVILFLC